VHYHLLAAISLRSPWVPGVMAYGVGFAVEVVCLACFFAAAKAFWGGARWHFVAALRGLETGAPDRHPSDPGCAGDGVSDSPARPRLDSSFRSRRADGKDKQRQTPALPPNK